MIRNDTKGKFSVGFFDNGARESRADGERCEIIARYIVQCGDTVRRAAKNFGISKSTVHKEITDRLKRVNPGLYVEIREVLEKNKAERHIRGGEATKNRYARKKSAD